MGKFCNDISLEIYHTEPWRKIENFLKPKGQRDYADFNLTGKPPRLTLIRCNSLPGLSKDTNFDSNHFDEVNQFIEDNYEYFYLPEDPDDYRLDMDDDHDLVTDIDSDTLI